MYSIIDFVKCLFKESLIPSAQTIYSVICIRYICVNSVNVSVMLTLQPVDRMVICTCRFPASSCVFFIVDFDWAYALRKTKIVFSQARRIHEFIRTEHELQDIDQSTCLLGLRRF